MEETVDLALESFGRDFVVVERGVNEVGFDDEEGLAGATSLVEGRREVEVDEVDLMESVRSSPEGPLA